jgi:hypothetical protein
MDGWSKNSVIEETPFQQETEEGQVTDLDSAISYSHCTSSSFRNTGNMTSMLTFT